MSEKGIYTYQRDSDGNVRTFCNGIEIENSPLVIEKMLTQIADENDTLRAEVEKWKKELNEKDIIIDHLGSVVRERAFMLKDKNDEVEKLKGALKKIKGTMEISVAFDYNVLVRKVLSIATSALEGKK